MSVDSEAPPEREVRVHSIQWRVADLRKIEEAAEFLSAREHISVSMTDVIRRGALREAEALLAEAAAQQQAA
jgi:hypothetical protein